MLNETFPEVIRKLKDRQWLPYRMVTFDLGIARNNYELALTGAYVAGFGATDANSNLDIRFNEIQNDTINISTQKFVKTPFYRLYLTNAIQAGHSITLAIATFDVDLFEVGDLTSGDIAGIGTVTDLGTVEHIDYITPSINFDSWVDVTINNPANLIYTVPANRVLKIYNCFINDQRTNISALGIGVFTAVPVFVYHLIMQSGYVDVVNHIINAQNAFDIKRTVPAGYTINVSNCAGAKTNLTFGCASIRGWLETV